MRVQWCSKAELEAFCLFQIARYPRAEIDLTIARLDQAARIASGRTHRGDGVVTLLGSDGRPIRR